MTWWASAYFACYLTFGLWSLMDDFRTKGEPLWHIMAEVASDLCLVGAALSYWAPSVRGVLEPMLLGIFIVGLAVFLGLVAHAFRKHAPDPELSFHGKVFVAVSGSALTAAVSAPMLFWGFQAAVLGSYAGT